MDQSTDNRQRLLGTLDAIESVVVTFYRLLLGLIIAAVLAVVVFVIVRRPWGAGNQGEWFYFAIAVMLVLGWAIGQFVSLGRRQRGGRLPLTLQTTSAGDAHTWKLTFGAAPSSQSNGESAANADGISFQFSRNFQVPLATLSHDVLPDEDTLDRLEMELAAGTNFEDACNLLQPDFNSWNEQERRAYCLYLKHLLDERPKPNPGE